MTSVEYRNMVLLKENIGKLKYSPLAADVGVRRLLGVMKDHCESGRLSGSSLVKRRPISSSKQTKDTDISASLTSVFVLLSHMLVEVSRSQQVNESKLKRIQTWFASQLPEIYDDLVDKTVFSSIHKATEDILLSVQSEKSDVRTFKELEPRQQIRAKSVMALSNNREIPIQNDNYVKPDIRRPISAAASVAYLDNVTRKIFPDEDMLGQMEFANRRGMPFAHRYTAHIGGERPENSLMKGIRKMAVEQTHETHVSQGSALDPDFIDQVASNLESSRERIVESPTRGFRQPVVEVRPHSSIVMVPPSLSTGTAPPSSPRRQDGSSIDVRKTTSLLLTRNTQPNKKETLEENLDSFRESISRNINIRSPPIPEASAVRQEFANNLAKSKPRLSSAPPGQRRQIHSHGTAFKMQKQRMSLHQASRESAGFQAEDSKNPENDLKDVLSVKFLLRSRGGSRGYGRFSMRDHFRMLRQMSSQSQRIQAPPTTPSYFSFCASASGQPDGDDTDSLDALATQFGRNSAPPMSKRPMSSTGNTQSSDVFSLVSQVDSAMEFSRQLQKELEAMHQKEVKDEQRPKKLAKDLKSVGQSVPIFRARLHENPDYIFEKNDKKRKAAVVIQRYFRGLHVRRQIFRINTLLKQIDEIQRGLLIVKATEYKTSIEKWHNEAKLYKRIIERIIIHRQQVANKLSGEKYPRRIQKPSVKFTLEAFIDYLQMKLAISTEFRRRVIGGTVGQSELMPAYRALGSTVTAAQIEAGLADRFGMRYRYKSKQLSATDFIDLFWALEPPSGTPPAPKPLLEKVLSAKIDTAEQQSDDSVSTVDDSGPKTVIYINTPNAELPPEYSSTANEFNDFRVKKLSKDESSTRPHSALHSSKSLQLNRQSPMQSQLSTRKPKTATGIRPTSSKSRTFQHSKSK